MPTQTFEDDAMILDVVSGNYFETNEVGYFIWNQLDGRRSIAQLRDRVVAHFEIDAETALQDVQKFVRLLDRWQLVSLSE